MVAKIDISILFYIILAFASCGNRPLVIKSITLNNLGNGGSEKQRIALCWYRESYITNTKSFVSVKINGDETVLLSSYEPNLTDIDLREDTILIKAYHPYSIDKGGKTDLIRNFKVIMQKSSFKEWYKHYHPGEKYFPLPSEK